MTIIKLLPSIKKLFWDLKVESLDLQKNKKTIIVRTLNYGKLKDWLFLKKVYGSINILDILQGERSGVNARSIKLGKIIFT